MTRDLWAILGMIIFAVVYGVDRKIGTLLFVIIVLAMLMTWRSRLGAAWETPIPPTVH